MIDLLADGTCRICGKKHTAPLAVALWGLRWSGDAIEMARRLEAELNRLGYRIEPAA
jgi:hypothetical protein